MQLAGDRNRRRSALVIGGLAALAFAVFPRGGADTNAAVPRFVSPYAPPAGRTVVTGGTADQRRLARALLAHHGQGDEVHDQVVIAEAHSPLGQHHPPFFAPEQRPHSFGRHVDFRNVVMIIQ